MTKEYYLGLMAGTSLDAVDCAIISIDGKNPSAPHVLTLEYCYSEPIPPQLRQQLLSLTQKQDNEIALLMELDVQMGYLFANSCLNAIKQSSLSLQQIRAIGSHGQTIRHYPHATHPTTLQIGDANIIAELTGVTTIADFRRRDMAAGGQGAPLVPPFHAELFGNQQNNRCVVNIGGIANITCLPGLSNPAEIIGFDTGPGNTFSDIFCQEVLKTPYDDLGKMARQGNIIQPLLEKMLGDNYFSLPFPKSTGREYFGRHWLVKHLSDYFIQSASKHPSDNKASLKLCQIIPSQRQTQYDILSTLVELTATTLCLGIQQAFSEVDEVLICGGGAKNDYLMERIERILNPIEKEMASVPTTDLKQRTKVAATDDYGMPAAWVESSAFAWLAMKTLHNQAGNLPSVTGARQEVILGAIFPGNPNRTST